MKAYIGLRSIELLKERRERMSKVFVIPDIHLKPWIMDKAEEYRCVIFTMDKANGKTKTPEPPSPFSFAKEYRLRDV